MPGQVSCYGDGDGDDSWNEMLHHELLKTFCRLWRHPNVSRDELIAFQQQKLRVLVEHAYANVPYYRELFDRIGLRPEDIRQVEDLHAVPITSSKDLRILPAEEISARGVNINKLIIHNTSGSSGQPFTVRREYWEEHLLNMFRIRAMRQLGVRISDRIARIAIVSGLKGVEGLRITLPRWVRQSSAIFRVYHIDCLQDPEVIVKELDLLKPDVILGYPSVIANLSPVFAGSRTSTNYARLILSAGESLPPVRRCQIQDHFRAQVYDLYGANECNLVAWECPVAGHYHICDDNMVLEILRDGRAVNVGERGEVVITCLHSYAMPFIRYSLGDVVIKGTETCSCGQPFSTLESIRGRMHDYFHLPGHRVIHPDRIVVGMMKTDAAWIRQFQVLQEREDRVVLSIWPMRDAPREGLARIERCARDVLGPEVHFDIRLVDELFFESSGKFRFCRSLVDSPPEGIDRERA